MNTADAEITTQDDLVRFPSLASLRAAHSDLLQRRRDSQETHEFLIEIDDFIRKGQATGALLDTDDERWATQSLLDYWANVLDHAGIEPSEATLAEFDPTLAPELDDALCPYRGLDAFREGSYFFGRQRLIETLVGCLDTQRLLAVLGPSGSGKSSLVLAGLLPALQAGALPDSQHWHYYPPMVPGPDPLASLARQIRLAGVNPDEWTTQQVEGLQHNPGHLVQLVGEISAGPAVLVVDQFEEVFTLCHDDHVRQAFVDNLLSFVQAPGVKHILILTMRSDFESQVARLPTFQPLFEQAQVRVTPLNADELREAIEKPAELIGLKFEEGIVNELVKEILGEPAGLPLLQFTLLKLWENRERNRVTWEAYRQLGGCRQALARSANAFYNALIPEEQVTTKRILLRLARPGEGLEVTSNRVRRETLYQAGEARDRVERVLDKLLQARLVRLTPGDTPDSDQVEVAHEALVRNWDTLVAWLEEERVTMRQRLRLTTAAEQWNALGKDTGALLRGALLDEALHYTDLNELETQFVQASQEAAEAAAREKEAAHQRELEQTRALAEEQRRRAEVQTQAARRLRYLSVALGVFAIIVLGFAELARIRKQAVEREKTYAQTLFQRLDQTVTVKRDPESVKWLQASLNTMLGTRLAVDGTYNLEVFEAVKAFQRQYGLVVDGLAGAQTRRQIRELLHEDTTDDAAHQRAHEDTTDDAARQRAYVQSLLADTYTVDREPEQVQWLQASLNKILGTHLAVDGDYNPATFEAVKEFQRQYGLEVDGLAGTSTIQKMRELQDKIPTDSKPLDPESRPAVVATYPARESMLRQLLRATGLTFLSTLLGVSAPSPAGAQGSQLHIDAADTPLMISGRLDREQRSFGSFVRLMYTGEDTVKLVFLPSDLRDGERVINRADIVMEGSTDLSSYQPVDIRITLKNVVYPGTYRGALHFMLVGQPDMLKLPVEARIGVVPHVVPVTDTLAMQAVHCAGMRCWLASLMLPEHTQRDRWPVQLENRALLSARVTGATVVVTSPTGVVGDTIRLAAPVTIPPHDVRQAEVVVERDRLAPGTYSGSVHFRVDGADDPVILSFQLFVRSSPLIPLLAILLGILVGRIARGLETPQAQAQPAARPYWQDTIRRTLTTISGIPANAEVHYYVVRPLLWLLALVFLALIGLQNQYINTGASFGAAGIYDFLGLFLWGVSADIASTSILRLPETSGKK